MKRYSFVSFAYLFMVSLTLSGCPVRTAPAPAPSPTPILPTLPTPSFEMQNIVRPFEHISEPDLSLYFIEFADVLERDSSDIIKSNYHFAKINSQAGKLVFQKTGFQGKYPNLGEDLAAATVTALGNDQGPLNKPRAIEFLRALAWATQ